MILYLRQYYYSMSLCLMLCAVALLSSCTSLPQGDSQASRIDVVHLPKFGTDPYWGGHQVAAEYLKMRESTLQRLSQSDTLPTEFALQVTQDGWQYIATQDYTTAMKRFNQAWLIAPEQSALAIMGMALVVYERDGDVQGGLGLMDSLHVQLANEPTYWSNYASMLQRNNQPAEALALYEQSHALAAGNSMVMRNLLRLYATSGNFQQACDMLRQTQQYAIEVEQDLRQYIVANTQQNCVAS